MLIIIKLGIKKINNRRLKVNWVNGKLSDIN